MKQMVGSDIPQWRKAEESWPIFWTQNPRAHRWQSRWSLLSLGEDTRSCPLPRPCHSTARILRVLCTSRLLKWGEIGFRRKWHHYWREPIDFWINSGCGTLELTSATSSALITHASTMSKALWAVAQPNPHQAWKVALPHHRRLPRKHGFLSFAFRCIHIKFRLVASW